MSIGISKQGKHRDQQASEYWESALNCIQIMPLSTSKLSFTQSILSWRKFQRRFPQTLDLRDCARGIVCYLSFVMSSQGLSKIRYRCSLGDRKKKYKVCVEDFRRSYKSRCDKAFVKFQTKSLEIAKSDLFRKSLTT